MNETFQAIGYFVMLFWIWHLSIRTVRLQEQVTNLEDSMSYFHGLGNESDET